MENNSKEQLLKMKSKIYGYKYGKRDYLESKEYLSALVTLEKMKLPEPGSLRVPKMDLSRIKTVVTNFFNTTFGKINYDVLYMSEKDVSSIGPTLRTVTNISKLNFKEQIDLLLKLTKEKSKKVSVFNLPILGIKDGISMDGEVKKFLMLVEDDEYLKSAPIVNNSVLLGEKYDRLSVGTYAHEITHALLERNKGSVENLYNTEILSIFMEKCAIDSLDNSKNKNLLKISELYRAAQIKNMIGKLSSEDLEEQMGATQYVHSGLMAGILFEKYQEESQEGKKRVMSKVKKVLCGELTVEKLLKEEKIRLDNDDVLKYVEKIKTYSKELEKQDIRV